MPRLQSANNAASTLTAGITIGATTFTVADASIFPAAPFRITIDAEVLEVTVIEKATNTFTVLRAQEGTTAATHNAGAAVENRFTAGTYGELAADVVSDTTPTNPTTGLWWTDTSVTPARKKYYNGTAWVDPLKYQ